jgi:hypothetical protein
MMESFGGKELMVISAPTLVEVQPWDVRGGEAGYGSKEESKWMRVRVWWEVKDGFHVHCSVWGDISSGRENWGKSLCKAIANCIVNSNYADACAFEDVVTKNIDHCSTCTNWLVGSRV